MKHLLIIRHAKSSWENLDLSDIERPLNNRGQQDALLMVDVLKGYNLNLDKIYCSTATRARMTIEILAKGLGLKLEDINFVDELYNASRKDLLNLIRQLNDNLNSVAVVGHNPGLTDLTHYLLYDFDYELPTSAIVMIELKIDSWSSIKSGIGTLKFFEFPRKYRL